MSSNENVYIFKVTQKRGIWRRIKISVRHTLQHLHEAIQGAFEFNDDHMYAFFMNGKPWSSDAYWCRGDHQPCADQAKIGTLGLTQGQKFLYLFDFGDEWKFDVKLEKILHSDTLPAKPLIIESRGTALEQYPDFEDEDE